MTASRDSLLSIRPTIAAISKTEAISPEEDFQNTTIRAILKFQNDLLIAIYAEHIAKHKSLFYNLSIPDREGFIRESLQKEPLLKNYLIGTVVGLFTQEEFSLFMLHEKELRRRISDLIIQRLQDQVGKFEE